MFLLLIPNYAKKIADIFREIVSSKLKLTTERENGEEIRQKQEKYP